MAITGDWRTEALLVMQRSACIGPAKLDGLEHIQQAKKAVQKANTAFFEEVNRRKKLPKYLW